MAKLKVLIAVSVAIVGASSLQAQVCLGLPSFASGSVHVNASAEFPDSATTYTAAVSGGRQNGPFASLGGGQVTYSYADFDGNAKLVFLELGIERPIAGFQICPITGGYLSLGPDDPDFGIKVTSRGAAAGLAAGLPLGNHSFRVIPNAAVKYQYTSQTVEEENIASGTETYHDGWVDFGLGMVIRDRLSIQPLAHIPVVGDGNEPTYGVFVSASIGW